MVNISMQIWVTNKMVNGIQLGCLCIWYKCAVNRHHKPPVVKEFCFECTKTVQDQQKHIFLGVWEIWLFQCKFGASLGVFKGIKFNLKMKCLRSFHRILIQNQANKFHIELRRALIQVFCIFVYFFCFYLFFLFFSHFIFFLLFIPYFWSKKTSPLIKRLCVDAITKIKSISVEKVDQHFSHATAYFLSVHPDLFKSG